MLPQTLGRIGPYGGALDGTDREMRNALRQRSSLPLPRTHGSTAWPNGEFTSIVTQSRRNGMDGLQPVDGIHRGECLVTDLGLIGIPEADGFMAAAQSLRSREEIPDVLLFMAHPKTVALGLRDRRVAHPKDLLVSPHRLEQEGIALTRSVRGGGITYHWPGQVVCYPVLALKTNERSIPAYMNNLEEVGIRTLRRFGVRATRRRDAAAYVGLWTSRGKIVSMGVRISNWVTSFGFVINVQGDHRESQYVRPCGIEGVKLVTLEEILGTSPSRTLVLDAIKECFTGVFGRTLEDMPGAIAAKIRATDSRAENHWSDRGAQK